MREGWFEDDYLILFAEEEVAEVSERYGMHAMLPGFQIVGFRGWDDFIVRNGSGDLFTVPTVPCDAEYLASYEAIVEPGRLKGDARFEQKSKWYVKPVAFGGERGRSCESDMDTT